MGPCIATHAPMATTRLCAADQFREVTSQFYSVEVVIEAKAQDVVRKMSIPGSRTSEDWIKAVTVERTQIDVEVFNFPDPGRCIGNNASHAAAECPPHICA